MGFRLRAVSGWRWKHRSPLGHLDYGAWLSQQALVLFGWLLTDRRPIAEQCSVLIRERRVHCRCLPLTWTRDELRPWAGATGQALLLHSPELRYGGWLDDLRFTVGQQEYLWTLRHGLALAPFLDEGQVEILLQRVQREVLLTSLGSIGLWPLGSAQTGDRAQAANQHWLARLAEEDDPSQRSAYPRPGSEGAAPADESLPPPPSTYPCLIDPSSPFGFSFEALAQIDPEHLFLRGWIWDLEGRLDDVVLCGSDGSRRTGLLDEMTWHRRTDVEHRLLPQFGPVVETRLRGFVGLVPLAAPFERNQAHWLELRCRQERDQHFTLPNLLTDPELALWELQRALELDCSDPRLIHEQVAPAMELLAVAPRIERQLAFGPKSETETALIAAVPEDRTAIESQIAILALDPDARAAELVYVLQTPATAEESARHLASLAEAYGLRMVLVVPDRPLAGIHSAWKLGAEASRGAELLFWDVAVLPTDPGWIGQLRQLSRDSSPGAIAPQIQRGTGMLEDAPSVLHRDSGLAGEWRWAVREPLNLPAQLAPDTRRSVACTPPRALWLQRSVLDLLEGWGNSFWSASYACADLCLSLWQHRLAVLYAPMVRFRHLPAGPAAPLPPKRLQVDRVRFNRRWKELLHAAPWQPSEGDRHTQRGPTQVIDSARSEPRSLRVAHVIGTYLPEATGGTQLQLRDLCRAQVRAGHHAAIFTRVGMPELPDYELIDDCWDGIAVRRLNYNYRDSKRFEDLFSQEHIDRCFEQWIEGLQPDLVHFHHWSHLSLTMVDVARQRAIPVIAWLSDFWLQCPRGQRYHPVQRRICDQLDRRRCARCLHPLLQHVLPGPRDPSLSKRCWEEHPATRQLESWQQEVTALLNRCDALLFPSSFHRQRFLEMGVEEDRCHVVEYGLRREDFQKTAKRRGPDWRIGYVGTLLPTKGAHVLIDAVARLGRPDVRLHLYGEVVPCHEDHSYVERLRLRAPKLDELHFHGRYEIEELPEILAGLDILVVPALWWESYCLTAREGMLGGLPVVVSPVGGMAEAVQRGQALHARTGSAEGLQRALQRLMDDPQLRARLQRQDGTVRELSACAQEVETIYRSLLTARELSSVS